MRKLVFSFFLLSLGLVGFSQNNSDNAALPASYSENKVFPKSAINTPPKKTNPSIQKTNPGTLAAENCTNGIDDDGNGLTDLNDPACTCSGTSTGTVVPSMIPNPSFETMACCPSTYSQVNCASGWVQATSATSDYMNTCGFVFGAATNAGLVPFPSGNGILGTIFSPGWQEYVGSCLTGPMVAGTAYSLQMNIASTPIDNFGDVCNGGVIDFGPIDIVIYGAANCSSLPAAGTGCPGAPWVVLGQTTYNPVASWGTMTINFTPSTNINTIMFGSPCTLPASYSPPSGCYPYFYYDNIVLNTTTAFTPPGITQSGTFCNNNIQLAATVTTGVTYQWYLNGVALVGQTAQTLNVSGNSLPAGVYQLVTQTGGWSTCGIATTTVTSGAPTPPTLTPSGPFCSNAAATTFTASTGGGTWGGTGVTNPATGTFNPGSATIGNNVITYTLGTGVCATTASMNVVVNPLPIANAGTDISICAGTAGTIGTAATAGNTYTWTPTTGLSSSSISNPSITLPNAGTTPITSTYTVTTTSAAGCTSSDVVNVTVNPLPVVTATSGTICAGFTTTLTANGAITYTWSPATGLSSTNGSPVIANPGSTTIYTITGTDANGCVSPVNGGLNNGTSTVTVGALPTITANSGTICVGQQTATLTANGGNTYAWSPATGLSATSGATVIANPAVTTSYTITGTSAGGCVNTGTTSVVVNPLPVVTASGSTVCVNGTINLNSGGATTYTWAGPGGYVSTQQNPSITNATSAMSGTYSVIATNANGCISGNTAQVLVSALPGVVASNNSPVCVGASFTLSTSSGVSWVWTGPNGFNSISQNPSQTNAQLTATGTYTLNILDANGCSGSAVTTVTVNPLPTVTATSSTICVSQQTATLTAGGASTYVWSPATGLGSTIGTSVTGTPSVTSVYTVTGTDANGCVSTASTSILVNPLPIVTVTGSTVCINATINLSANGGVLYSWGGPNGFISNTQNPSIANATQAMSGAYAVTVTDANGCVNGNVTQVLVNPFPVVTATSTSICVGSSGMLSAGGANSYVWSPTTGLNSSTGQNVAVFVNTGTIYTVTGTDVNGCVSSATCSVTVNPIPVLAVTPPTSSGCAPLCVTLSNTTTASGNCVWNFGDGTTSNSCTPTHCFTGKGTFSSVLSLTDNNGCVNTTTATVIVYPVPTPDFNATPQPTSILDPTIHFTNATTGAVITSYNWTFGDPNNSTSTQQNPIFMYQAVGSYPVLLVVTSDYGCKDSTIKIIKIEDEFMIYVPNAFSPNADGVNDIFFAKGEGIKDFKIYIFDRWGTQVFFSDDIYKGWDGRYQSKGSDIVQEDVYVWKIEVKTTKGENKMLRGHVSLIK